MGTMYTCFAKVRATKSIVNKIEHWNIEKNIESNAIQGPQSLIY